MILRSRGSIRVITPEEMREREIENAAREQRALGVGAGLRLDPEQMLSPQEWADIIKDPTWVGEQSPQLQASIAAGERVYAAGPVEYTGNVNLFFNAELKERVEKYPLPTLSFGDPPTQLSASDWRQLLHVAQPDSPSTPEDKAKVMELVKRACNDSLDQEERRDALAELVSSGQAWFSPIDSRYEDGTEKTVWEKMAAKGYEIHVDPPATEKPLIVDATGQTASVIIAPTPERLLASFDANATDEQREINDRLALAFQAPPAPAVKVESVSEIVPAPAPSIEEPADLPPPPPLPEALPEGYVAPPVAVMPPPPVVAPNTCPGCGFVGATPAGLNRHKTSCRALAPKG